MSHIINDKGHDVAAWGTPGSLVRTGIEWPALIERLQAHYEASAGAEDNGIKSALEIIREAGAKDTGLTACSLLQLAGYGPEEAHNSAKLIYDDKTEREFEVKAVKDAKAWFDLISYGPNQAHNSSKPSYIETNQGTMIDDSGLSL
jgi:hypothetical protein